jgi:hypothetical protein
MCVFWLSASIMPTRAPLILLKSSMKLFSAWPNEVEASPDQFAASVDCCSVMDCMALLSWP